MSIEFHCSSCNRLLKTPPQTAGKKGKCPHCGSLMQIPMQSTVRPNPPGLTPLGDSSGLTPLGGAPAGGGMGDLLDDLPPLQPLGDAPGGASNNPFGGVGGTALRPGSMSSNPYASPTLGAEAAPKKKGAKAAAKSMVLGPAIGLIAYASLALLVYIGNLVLMIATDGMAPPPNMDDAQRVGYIVGFYGVLVLSPIVFIVILAGGIMMMNLKAYGLAITACIMTFLPCSLCCLLGLPFGIWGLVALNNEKVKRVYG